MRYHLEDPPKVLPKWSSYTNSNYIRDLALDKDVLWVAGGGLTKFDFNQGTRIKYLREHGLASNNVLKMILHDNTLWIATANGISCHDLQADTWRSFYKTDGLPDDAVTAVTTDVAENLIWFGSWEGYLFNFNNIKKKWDFLTREMTVPDTIISALTIDPAEGTLLIGTWGKGLRVYNPRSRLFIRPRCANGESLEFISAILFEGKKVWIGTVDKGLWVGNLNREVLKVKKIKNLSDCMITSIKASLDGDKVFVTTMGNGLLVYSNKTGEWERIDKKHGISTDLLNTSVYDGKTIFLGSEGEGIFTLNLSTAKLEQYKSLDEIANNKVSEVTPDPQNNCVWIGTEGNGAACLDLLSKKWTILSVTNNVLPSDVVNCITVDNSAHVIWIGTDHGMVRYERQSGNHRHYGFEEGLSNVLVYASSFDHVGRLWAAFYIGNPAIFNAEEKRWKSVAEAPSVICHALSPDFKNSAMWMATSQGIIHYDIERRKFITYWDDIEFRSLLYDEEKKEIWAGSWCEGLFHMDVETGKGQKIKRFENLSVLDIKKDEEKNMIWFATDAGAYYFDRERQTFGHLDVTNGLGLNFVLSVGITRDSIWFGTWDGGLSRLQKN